MAAVTTKSLSIINWDAIPSVEPTTGEGAPGNLRCLMDSVSSVIGDTGAAFPTAQAIYRCVRIPTNAKIKQVWLYSPAITTGAGDIEVLYSDSTTDGTQASLNGVVTIAAAAANKLFGAAQTLAANPARQDKTFAGTFLPIYQNLPIWQVLVALGTTQFSADPGGFFDLGIALTTTIATAGGTVGLEAYWVE